MSEKIDFVVTWVDGNDAEWRKQRDAYCRDDREEYSGERRFRDWDLMRYWFRGVEKFAPWVNQVYFVTCGHLPAWLNVDHPKHKVVTHKEYLPETALPTFNANAIELGIHKLEGLSEHFVMFNDDMFLLNHVEPDLFFHNGLPCDYAALDAIVPTSEFWHIIINNVMLINQNFSKRKCIKENWGKWFSLKDVRSTVRTLRLLHPWQEFTGFRDFHVTIPYLKSEFEDLWERFPKELNETVHHRFRTERDLTIWIFRYWRLARGKFCPRSQRYGIYQGLATEKKIEKAMTIVAAQKKKVICLNDTYEGNNFEAAKARIQQEFEKILPDPCSFEKQ